MMTSLRSFLGACKAQTALSILAAVCTLLAGIGLMTSSGYLISRAALRPPILDLMLIIVAVRFFALSRAGFRYLERLVSHDLTFRWLMALRVRCYRVLTPLMPALLLRRRSGDLLGRLVADVDTLQNLYLRVVAPAITAAIVVTVTVAALHAFSPLLAWVTFAFLALNGVALPRYMVRATRGWGAAQISARSRLHADLVETLQGASDLLMFGRDLDARETIAAHDRELAKWHTKQFTWTGLQDSLTVLCAHGGMWTILVLSIPMISAGQINGVVLALLTLGVLTSFEAVQSMGAAFQYHEQTIAAARRLNELEAMPRLTTPEPETVAKASHKVVVEHVHFAYDEEPVLHDIDFVWPQGKRIGVIGPSGSGKSTLAHLLLRFRDPDRGAIRLGKTDLRQIPQEEVLRRFAVVPQHTHLFNNSIRENLILAKPDAADDALWHALEQARLADFVRNLPDGMDTLIGEQGARLSGGERQRMAIARALLKDAPLMILDEPTTNLDARTEREIIDTLLKHTTGKSVLWITHRLIRLNELDTLIVIADGRIHERGSHAECIANNDYYARMLRQQNQVLGA